MQARLTLRYIIDMSEKSKVVLDNCNRFSIDLHFLMLMEKENLRISAESRSIRSTVVIWMQVARLESIKQALVDITLGSEIELSSAAYLDDSGVLRETSVMTTNAKVRGVRVLSYVKAAAGIAEAELNAEVLSDKSCPGVRSSLIREAVVQVAQNYKNHRVGNHYLNEINELLENTVVDKLSSVEGWSVSGFSVEEPYYMRLVSGRPGKSRRL